MYLYSFCQYKTLRFDYDTAINWPQVIYRSLGTQTIENGFEMGSSPWRELQKGRSLSQKVDDDPEALVEPDCSCLKYTQIDSYELSFAIEEISAQTNETIC